MEISPENLPLPQSRHKLKRSASTASLPTPPRTHRRHKRGRSRGDCDSESDKEEAFRTQRSTLSSSDDEDDNELPVLDQKSYKKRRLSQGKGNDGEEEAFWLAGPDPEPHRQAETVDASDINVHDDDTFAPLVYRRSLKRSQSQTSSGLVSPPPSRRKLQPHVPITPPAGTPGPSTSTTSLPQTQPASPPKTPKKRTGLSLREGLKTPEFPVISDSPDNPFYVIPGSPSPGEESESPCVDSASPRTPSGFHEKPQVTYVFRGVRRKYDNPLYNHRKNRPLTPPPASLLPIEHPDYSPDISCKPRMLFPIAKKGKRMSAVKSESKGAVGGSSPLRRSPRRNKAVVDDSDDEKDGQGMFKPQKLDFGLPKNATSKAKAKVAIGSDDIF